MEKKKNLLKNIIPGICTVALLSLGQVSTAEALSLEGTIKGDTLNHSWATQIWTYTCAIQTPSGKKVIAECAYEDQGKYADLLLDPGDSVTLSVRPSIHVQGTYDFYLSGIEEINGVPYN